MTTRQQRETDAYNVAMCSQRLQQLLLLPVNKYCADCKISDPRWAVYNFGIFVCIRCAGIHRGLGTHISKVRSVDLDTWTPDMVYAMEQSGNQNFNFLWE